MNPIEVVIIVIVPIIGGAGIVGLLARNKIVNAIGGLLAMVALVPAVYYGILLWTLSSRTLRTVTARVDIVSGAYVRGEAIGLLALALAIVSVIVYRAVKH